MKIVYDGPHSSRLLVLSDGAKVAVERGEPIELPAVDGDRLLASPHWSKPKRSKRDDEATPEPDPSEESES